MLVDFAMKAGTGASLPLNIQKGALLPQIRFHMVREAFAYSATHILFIDSDQDFPPHTWSQLLSHRLPIVGCNIATKQIPVGTTARWMKPNGDPIVVWPRDNAPALQRVDRLGLGVCLVEIEVFRRVAQPWFEVRWNPLRQEYIGEDWFFMQKAAEAGYDIWLDNVLSPDIGHWGSLRFELEMCEPPPIPLFDGLTNNGIRREVTLVCP
jgi:hypothetical protein